MEWHEREYDRQVLRPPEPRLVAYCTECGEEIYEGMKYYRFDDYLTCLDDDCLLSACKSIVQPKIEQA